MFTFLTTAGVVAVGALVASLGLVAFGRSGSNAEIRRRQEATGMSAEDYAKVKKAEKDIHAAENLAYRVRDAELREGAKEALAKATKIIATMKKQPAEIRRATQFFGYYLPTIVVVLQKYLSLEENNKLDDEIVEHTRKYVADMSHAFDLQFDNLFKDESLDLTVEVEAMQMALKRDGLS